MPEGHKSWCRWHLCSVSSLRSDRRALLPILCTHGRRRRFNAGQPGFGISACDYLAKRKVILVGGDNWGTEAGAAGSLAGENEQPVECHIKLLVKHGIWNIENLDLTQLVEDGISEFLFVWAPLKMKGATGSPGNPVAIY